MTRDQGAEERRKFVGAFNSTMVRIWQERIRLLGVYDTGMLLKSVRGVNARLDADAVEGELSQEFLLYGIYQNYGTGGEVYRGNAGDIGRDKVRERRPWFSKKYYGSVMNLQEFFAKSLGREAALTICNVLTK